MSFSCRSKVDEEREPILSKHVSISLQSSFFKWPRAGLFFFIFVFSVDSKQMCNMAGFEPRTSGYGSVFTSDYFNLFFFDLLPPHFFGRKTFSVARDETRGLNFRVKIVSKRVRWKTLQNHFLFQFSNPPNRADTLRSKIILKKLIFGATTFTQTIDLRQSDRQWDFLWKTFV